MKKWIKNKLLSYFKIVENINCEEYFIDSFDKEHLYFVALGVTTIENYAEMKRQYYEKRIDKISQ